MEKKKISLTTKSWFESFYWLIKFASESHFLSYKDPDIGSSIASQFKDGNWYRGTVVKVRNNSEMISIFYVDYGDVEKKKVSETFHLNPKFQDLNHQAIHCSLEGVNPM